MILLQNLTPSVYYKQSRDFQFIGRLYDIVLNSVKTNASLLYGLPLSDNTDTRLMELMSLTLGFKSKHNYNIEQLTALCKSFLTILRNKGSKKAIEMAANTLLNAEGITSEIDFYMNPDDSAEAILVIPHGLSDVNLLLDILNYILPAGVQFTLITENTIKETGNTVLNVSDTVKSRLMWANATSYVPKISNSDEYIDPYDFSANGIYHGAKGAPHGDEPDSKHYVEGGYVMSTFISNIVPSMDEPYQIQNTTTSTPSTDTFDSTESTDTE